MGLPPRLPVLSPAEYLQIERQAEYRSEYYAGEMFAMAGGSPRHSRIKTNVLTQLNLRLKDRECTPYDSDLRIRVPETNLYTYPDASVICGDMEFDDDQNDTATNPTLIVEVLSRSTEAYDRGMKFDQYRRLDSLREYVLVSHDAPRIERFLRNNDGTWNLSIANGLEQSIMLESIGVTLSLADVYLKVDFNGKEPLHADPAP
jgi:Uma2 family endonuclease